MTETHKANFDFEVWIERFRGIVKRDAHAARSWQAMTEAGADPDRLGALFAFACDLPESPAFRLIELLRSNALQEARSALSLAARLDSDREALNRFNSSLPEGLIEKLTDAAKVLRDSAFEARKMFSKHKMKTSFFLSWLITSVQEQTKSPRYGDVSTLLECAHVAYGHEMPIIGEEAVRKVHARFMKDSPFRELLTAEGKNYLFIIGVIYSAFHFLQSGKALKASPPSQNSNVALSGDDLMKSLNEIFRKNDSSFKT